MTKKGTKQTDSSSGEEVVEIPLDELVTMDISDKKVEQRARAFIMGTQSIGRRKEVMEILEEKIVQKIGKKGKYLTDKLFELIEGVYVVDKRGGKNGRDIRYYQVPPNLQAIIYAIDRVIGKPVAKTEVNERKEGVMVVESIIRQLAGGQTVEVKKTTKLT
jgi:hypothetical protein